VRTITATLEELRDRAIDEAARTGTLNDITQAITAAKTVADERKSIEDLASARRSLRLSQIQTIVTSITVIISVLGLVATSVYNIAQISAAHEQIETTQWRDLLSSLDSPNANIPQQSLTVPFRLRSFANSKRYSQDARLIGAAVLSKVTDIDGFQQLFNFIFADQPANLDTILEIDRQLYSNWIKNVNACREKSKGFVFPKTEADQNVCWDAYTDKQVQDFGVKIEDLDIWAMRKVWHQQGIELDFMSSKIAPALRSAVEINRGSETIKLTNLFIVQVDLSKLDFSHIDISGSSFSAVILTQATLRPAKFDDNSSFSLSNWWDAAIIDKPLLQKLINTDFPSKSHHFMPRPPRPTRLEYVSAVLALCHKVDLTCTEAHIPYEEDETRLSD
jgi:hypothetical protein